MTGVVAQDEAATPAGGAGDPGAIACPRCGRPVATEQEWCLACGAAARTRLAPAPAWRAPLVLVAVVVVVAALLLTWGFLAVTRDEEQAAPAAQPAAPAQPAPPAQPAAP